LANKIKKAVFPVGGMGTRFLPATKTIPKEMMPIIDKPLIQYAVDEARAAGIEEFIFVTGRGKSAIEDYFDLSYELNDTLKNKGNEDVLDALEKNRLPPGSVSFTRQQEPLGLGHAVWCARHLVGDAPFAVLLADDFIVGGTPCLKQMTDAFEANNANFVAVMNVPKADVSRYGVLDPGAQEGSLVEIKGLVEKPPVEEAPSTLSIVGRYILSPEIFTHLSAHEKGSGGEIQLTDAMAKMIAPGTFYGLEFEGTRFDCGNKLGFLKATAHVAAQDDELKEFLNDLTGRN